MSSKTTTQPRKLLAIPGPVETSDQVLEAISQPPISHMSPEFVNIFGDTIRMTRQVVLSKSAQVFILSGSGTLGWDQVAINLLEPGDAVLVLNSGYFGTGFKDCVRAYGAMVDEVTAPIGLSVREDEVRDALSSRPYKLVAFTHVDTSTGVLSDARMISQTVKKNSPHSLVVLDAVCSVASEEIQMDAWNIDVVLTASQKGLGTPPGLSILCASERAIAVSQSRTTPVAGYYCSWKRWIPIVRAYESGQAAYFGTPAVNLIRAYHASLKEITQGRPSLQDRFRMHKEAATRVRGVATSLGLRSVPSRSEVSANGMSAVYCPGDMTVAEIISRFAENGVIVAGGLHPSIKDKYFRIGHMGTSVVNSGNGDMDRLVAAFRNVFLQRGSGKVSTRL